MNEFKKEKRKMKSLVIERETSRSRTAEIGFKEEYECQEIKVGDGVTMAYYSDRHAATIIDIADNGAWIKVQQDKAIRIDNNGMSDDQEYRFERDPNGSIYTFKRTRKYKNMYTDNGVSKWGDYGIKLWFGGRYEYYDYLF